LRPTSDPPTPQKRFNVPGDEAYEFSRQFDERQLPARHPVINSALAALDPPGNVGFREQRRIFNRAAVRFSDVFGHGNRPFVGLFSIPAVRLLTRLTAFAALLRAAPVARLATVNFKRTTGVALFRASRPNYFFLPEPSAAALDWSARSRAS
jgi:hypothetical protein